VIVAATQIKPDDPYTKVTEEGVSSLSLDHLHLQKLEASIDRMGLVQEEFCLWVIPASWKGDANDQTLSEVCFCYFVCRTVTKDSYIGK
jgi:hypothetical protein